MSRSKIIPRIFGGLGNQCFCYAAARRLSLVASVELVLDDVSGYVRDHDYQRRCQPEYFNIPAATTPAERLESLSRVRLSERLQQQLVQPNPAEFNLVHPFLPV